MPENLPLRKNAPVSEGMDYGPFPLPDADVQPITSQWVMDEAGNYAPLYELLRLSETLENRNAAHKIDDEIYSANKNRLAWEIAKMRLSRRLFNQPRLRTKNT